MGKLILPAVWRDPAVREAIEAKRQHSATQQRIRAAQEAARPRLAGKLSLRFGGEHRGAR